MVKSTTEYECFGEMALLFSAPRSASVSCEGLAVTAVTALNAITAVTAGNAL